MESTQHQTAALLMTKEVGKNRRRHARINGRLEVNFSGMDNGEFVMDEGHVLNLSQGGIGIRTDRSLNPGMELALFVQLPGSEDHLCVPEARVAWVKGRRFGVALRTMKREDHTRLRQCLWASQQRQGHLRKMAVGDHVRERPVEKRANPRGGKP